MRFELHGRHLGLEESDLRSNKALPEVIRGTKPQADVDLDDLYQRPIKGLHGVIVDFATKAEPNMLPEQVEFLPAIRSVARDLELGPQPNRPCQRGAAEAPQAGYEARPKFR